MNRAALIPQIEAELGDRRLVWFGTRGQDAQSLTDIDQFHAAFSMIAPFSSRPSIGSLALESLTGTRVDLDTYDIDDHLRTPEVSELRAQMLTVLARPSALVTYRPTTFLSAVGFSRQDRCRHLGMFKDHQAAFEHKPWLETSVANLGLPHIPWRYVPDLEQLDVTQLLRSGDVMLRRSRTTGGVGLTRIQDSQQLQAMWPEEEEAFVSVAPYLEGGVPVNVGAVVWRDGVTVHPASIQLIGIDGCTTRPFGYCGNDFAAIRELEPAILDQIEASTIRIGQWMGELGFLGAFGVDYLVHKGAPLFTEVNPRMQGSTHASCRIAVELQESCLLSEHLAAHLGLPAPRTRTLKQWGDEGTRLSHLVVHHTGEDVAGIDPSPLVDALRESNAYLTADVLTTPKLATEPGAPLLRATVRSSVTETGHSLLPGWHEVLNRGLSALGDQSRCDPRSTMPWPRIEQGI